MGEERQTDGINALRQVLWCIDRAVELHQKVPGSRRFGDMEAEECFSGLEVQ